VSRFDWEKIRAEYEAGASQNELSKRHGCSRGAVQKHITAEGWSQDVRPVLDRMVTEKVAGVVAGSNPQKKAAALGLEADRRVGVVLQHRQEWEDLRKKLGKAKTFDDRKQVKITAETLKIMQEGERKAWGLEVPMTPVQTGGEADKPGRQVKVAVIVKSEPTPGGVLAAAMEISQ